MLNLNHSNINNILSSIIINSKINCYKNCVDEINKVGAGVFCNTALSLTFDGLFKHQINTMISELNLYFIFKGSDKISIKEIEDLENAYIEKCDFEISVEGILKYVVDYCCRKEFINVIHQYSKLYMVS